MCKPVQWVYIGRISKIKGLGLVKYKELDICWKISGRNRELDIARDIKRERNWAFGTNTNFRIPLSLQPDDVNLGYFNNIWRVPNI